MTKMYRLYQGQQFLGSRGLANAVRVSAEETLTSDSSAVVEFDFSGVRGVSHGYLDELLTPLSELLGEHLSGHVTFTNCSAAVVEAVDLVCEMHHLHRPTVTVAGERLAGSGR